MRYVLLIAAAALSGAALADPYVTQNLSLGKGKNHVYIELTPTNGTCEEAFGSCTAVTNVMCYDSRAFVQTAQYDSEGNLIKQKPVAYLVWHRNSKEPSTLRNVIGGMVYVIDTEAACTLSLTGRPQLPRLYWYETTTNDYSLLNLVAPSLPPTATNVKTIDYFGEGPAGGIPTTVERNVAGDISVSPYMDLKPGAVYAMSATHADAWSGVIGVAGADDGVTLGSNGTTQVSFALQNRGKVSRTFRLSYGPGCLEPNVPGILILDEEGWVDFTSGSSREFEIAAGEQTYVSLGVRPTGRTPGAGLLTIDDLGASKMRVRLPLVVEAVTADAITLWPNGIYLGSFTLNSVTYTNDTAEIAGGSVVGTLIYLRRGKDEALLQRICIGADKDGETVGGIDLEKVRKAAAEASSVRRISSVVLNPYDPVVPAVGSRDGQTLFAWVVDQAAPTNPMRHSWHPDHDGLRTLPDGSVVTAPDGDVLANYTESVKPELFSITNFVALTGLPVESDLTGAVDGTVSGTISWRLSGLRSPASGGDICCEGRYSLSRIGAITNFVDIADYIKKLGD